MAITFAESSNLNNDLWKDTDVAVKTILQDADKELKEDDKLLEDIFNVEKTDQWAEKSTGMTSLGDFEEVLEGERAVEDDVQQDFSKLIEMHQFIKGFSCTQNMLEDGKMNTMKITSRNYIQAYKRSRGKFGTLALVTEGATFTYGGKTYDKTTGDGKALFATDHPGKKDGVAAQSNVYTNAFGTDSSMLVRLANIGRNFENSSGEVMAYEFDTIIIPGNVPTLEDTVKRIINTELVVGSQNNDVNTQKGLWRLVINKRWIAADGTAPYIIASSEANKMLQAAMFYDRVILTMKDTIDQDTWDKRWSGRARFGCGFNDWRAFIMGGAQAGTTLS